MKFEADCESGIKIVKDFSKETNVLSDSDTLTIQDFIDQLGRPFEGTIGWEAELKDVIALADAEYIRLEDLPECPCCGHKLTHAKTKTEAAASASRENGKKGGRPRKK